MLSTLAGLVRPGLKISHLTARSPLWHPDFPLVVLWSQKAGCTTVVKWFFDQIGELEAAEAHSHWVHDYENSVFKARPGYREDCYRALRSGRPAIKFVRDPAARAYSGYLELCNGRVQRSAFWGRQRRQVLEHVYAGVDVPLTKAFSFTDYVSWLEASDLDGLDGHFRPQRVDLERHIRVEALPIERATEHFEALARRFDLKPVAGDARRILESGHHHEKSIDLRGPPLALALTQGLSPKRPASQRLPKVDTARLAGTDLGRRLQVLFADDYAAYPFYLPARASAMPARPTGVAAA